MVRKIKLLIIDDDEIDRLSVLRTLKNSNLEFDVIHEADTPSNGLELTQKIHFDIILLDYHLPSENGIEVLRTIRKTHDDSTAVVMLSNNSDEQLALQCIEAGAQDFLLKSEVSISRLRRAIVISTERYNLEQQLKRSHEQLRVLAEQDSLTGLSNRYFFDETLNHLIPQAERIGASIGLLMLDLDNFKNINDSLGHDAGDEFLKIVAKRLKKATRNGDHICRLGGDEFAVVVPNLKSLDPLRHLSSRIFNELSVPAIIKNKEIIITASIGVATYPECAESAMDLMKSADIAMYRAKNSGRNQTQYYSKEFHDEVERRIKLESDLKLALSNKELELYYQPQVDSLTGKLSGIETLIRWNHPDAGLIMPDQFISIAEESGLINDIGKWVIQDACRQFSSWRLNPKFSNLTLSIAANLSALQLRDTGLVAFLKESMGKFDISPEKLELELTENNLEASLQAIDVLKELANTGVKLALDDFGTGYSSLSHLHEYPFTVLKIDKTFVQRSDKPDNRGFLKAVSAFAHSLGYETVAEGVETEDQKQICAELGIKRLQGYYYSRPVPVAQFEKQWLV